MNKKQLISLWVGISIIVVMGLFPPWVVSLSDHQRDCGYDWIGTPPIYKWSSRGSVLAVNAHLDIPRLCLQWSIISVVTVGLLITFKDKKKN